jgi:hypothetical protein
MRRISYCLTIFLLLAMQLSIFGFPSKEGAFSHEKASCLKRQPTHNITNYTFRQAIFEKNLLIYNRFVKKTSLFLILWDLSPKKWVCCNKPTLFLWR